MAEHTARTGKMREKSKQGHRKALDDQMGQILQFSVISLKKSPDHRA
jgi:hypothetical protein